MTNAKNTKRALLASVLSIMLCAAMLVGSTFAWFTDSVTSGKNKIVAGNLDVELEYRDAEGNWHAVTQDTELFSSLEADGTENLWEPGHTEVVYLKVKNAGTLALKYQFAVNIANETVFTNALGNTDCRLSDYLVFGQVESVNEIAKYATREEAWAAAGDTLGLSDYTKAGELYPIGTAGKAFEQYVALVVYMPTSIGNEANYRGDVVPSIDLGVNLVATQASYEEDGFGSDYDAEAPALSYKVTPENIGEYLTGQHGSMSNTKLILAPGNYGKLEIGTLTAYSKDDTVYSCPNGNSHDGTPLTFTDMDAFQAHFKPGEWHGRSSYTRTIKNLTLVAEGNVTVDGLSIASGHMHDTKDPINTAGTGYYLTQKLSNINFVNIGFTNKVIIETSQPDTVIDGVTFEGCSFTTGGTASTNGQALRYYNEANNGNVKNLTVKNCSFNNCYQGIYTAHINGIAVTGCTFNTTGHNAIAVQSGSTAANHKAVVIEDNRFENINDRIIRFNEVGADTQISIKNNVATNCGDESGEVIKATSLADGITYDISGNNWGEGASVANPEFEDASTGVEPPDETDTEDPFA